MKNPKFSETLRSHMKDYQVYNPRAVVSVMMRDEFKRYWSETASYDAVVPLINMNYDGLKTAIIEMLSGAEVKVNTATFQNDVEDIKSKDDVLICMIHLGYLGYNEKKKTAFVPKPEYKADYSALIVELKWNQNAKIALKQIKDKKYVSSILNYTGDILLIGISYDKNSKKHECSIELYSKQD